MPTKEKVEWVATDVIFEPPRDDKYQSPYFNRRQGFPATAKP